jgi:hypothetical protein
MTEAIGVAFTTDTEGYFAGGANGVGPEILKSTDGGKSFEQIQSEYPRASLLPACVWLRVFLCALALIAVIVCTSFPHRLVHLLLLLRHTVSARAMTQQSWCASFSFTQSSSHLTQTTQLLT